MNYQIIRRTIGWLLLFEGIFLAIPLITAIVYWEKEFFSVLGVMLACIGLGLLCVWKKPKKDTIYAKEGLVITALSWIVMSLFGCLPFFISGVIPSFTDALFETVSGFTTTGATILSGDQIESMPNCLLIWRSFTHWIGGMGVLVFIMAFLPLSGARNMNLMKAESPGPTVDKLVPKVKTTAKILYFIYIMLTLTQFIFVLFGGVSVFEALNIAFSVAGTGGFAIRGDSFASYSPYVQVVSTIFMLLFSVNFNAYYLLGRGRFKDVLSAEVRVFFIIVFSAISLVVLNLCVTGVGDYTLGETIRHSAFTVASIISTTGITTENFDLWPAFSKTIIVTIMWIGACAGSTGGGIKVSRVMVLFKNASSQVRRIIHPNQIQTVSIDKKAVDGETIRTANAFIVVYLLIYFLSTLAVAIDSPSFEVAFTSVAATMNNVGPGLGAIGPAGNFAFYSNLSKYVFIFDMLAGRLEIFPIVVLFLPSTWKRN